MTDVQKLISWYMTLYHEPDGSERTPEPEEIERYKMMEEQILKGEN